MSTRAPLDLAALDTATQRGRVAGLMAAAASTLIAIASSDPAVDQVGLLALAAAISAAAVAFWVLADRFRPATTHAILASSSGLVPLAALGGGGRLAGALVLASYTLIAVHAGLLLRGRALLLQLAWAGAGVTATGILSLTRPDAIVLLGAYVAVCVTIAVTTSALVGQLRQVATTDALTGLVARQVFHESLQSAVAQARRVGHPLSLIVLDLDRFKPYNDTYGHPAGDRALREIGHRWRARVRTSDLLARIGGDEFAVLLPGTGPDGAHRLAQDLVRLVPEPLGCSYGTATWQPTMDADDLVEAADRRLYRSKAVDREVGARGEAEEAR